MRRLLVILILVECFQLNRCEADCYREYRDIDLPGATILTISATEHVECKEQCNEKAECKSIVANELEQTCDLKRTNSFERQHSNAAGSVLYEKIPCSIDQHPYLGCFDEYRRDLLQRMPVLHVMEVVSCIESCNQSEYAYAFLKEGDRCYCGNSKPIGRRRDNTQCDVGCTGDQTLYCGGENKFAVFSIKSEGNSDLTSSFLQSLDGLTSTDVTSIDFSGDGAEFIPIVTHKEATRGRVRTAPIFDPSVRARIHKVDQSPDTKTHESDVHPDWTNGWEIITESSTDNIDHSTAAVIDESDVHHGVSTHEEHGTAAESTSSETVIDDVHHGVSTHEEHGTAVESTSSETVIDESDGFHHDTTSTTVTLATLLIRTTPASETVTDSNPLISEVSTKALCDHEWVHFGDHCYFYKHGDKRFQLAARNKCDVLGADLVKIADEKENQFIASLLHVHTRAWIGLERLHSGVYQWVDGRSAKYTNWAPREPNTDKRCVTIMQFGGWNDAVCDVVPLEFICQKPVN